MAIAGDVLIKLAADFAEFSKGMDEATAKLDDFGKKADTISGQIGSFYSALKVGAATLGITGVVSQLKAFADQITQTGARIEDMARKLGVTGEQFQALELLAKRTGQPVEDLAKAWKANSDALDALVVDARNTAGVIDNEVTAALKRSQEASEKLDRQWQVMFAPIVAGAKSWVADQLEKINNLVEAFNLSKLQAIGVALAVVVNPWMAPQILNLGAAAAPAAAFGNRAFEQAKEQVDALSDRVARLKTELSTFPAGSTPAEKIARDIANAEAQLRSAQNRMAEALQFRSEPTMPVVQVTADKDKPTGGGGGGGTSEQDSIERQILRYQELAKAAQRTYDIIGQSRGKAVDDMQREVRVQQQVEEIVAKLGAKHPYSPEQLKSLHDAVLGYEQLRDKTQLQLQIEGDADATQRKWGDGTEAFAKIQRDLGRQLDTNRLHQTEFNRAMKEAKESTDQAALAARRYDDNLGSLAAGFAHAAAAYSRQHDLFSVGEAAFTGLTDAMGQGLDVLLGKSSKTFGQIAADFTSMLGKMALQAALSPVFKIVFGAITSVLSAGVSGAVSNVSGFAPGGGPIGPSGGATRAGGGDVYPRNSYWVGEFGPERFVPDAAGRIEPAGRGGVTINNYAPGVDVQARRGPNNDLEVTVQAVRRAMTRDVQRGGNEFASAMERTYRVSRGG